MKRLPLRSKKGSLTTIEGVLMSYNQGNLMVRAGITISSNLTYVAKILGRILRCC